MATRKRLSSQNFIRKELVIIKKLMPMITIMTHALETMKQLKNGFVAQYARFGSIVSVELTIFDEQLN